MGNLPGYKLGFPWLEDLWLRVSGFLKGRIPYRLYRQRLVALRDCRRHFAMHGGSRVRASGLRFLKMMRPLMGVSPVDTSIFPQCTGLRLKRRSNIALATLG